MWYFQCQTASMRINFITLVGKTLANWHMPRTFLLHILAKDKYDGIQFVCKSCSARFVNNIVSIEKKMAFRLLRPTNCALANALRRVIRIIFFASICEESNQLFSAWFVVDCVQNVLHKHFRYNVMNSAKNDLFPFSPHSNFRTIRVIVKSLQSHRYKKNSW